MLDLPDHPDIRRALATGYPFETVDDDTEYCEICGVSLENEDSYATSVLECVCAECLLDFCRR